MLINPMKSLPAAKIKHDAYAAIAEEEKIGVARIKLHNKALRLTGVVSGFSEADRMLLAWKEAASGPAACAFQVTFIDGKILRGSYPFRRGTRGRPSLSTQIRSCLHFRPVHFQDSPSDTAMALFDKHGRRLDVAILRHYDIPKQR